MSRDMKMDEHQDTDPEGLQALRALWSLRARWRDFRERRLGAGRRSAARWVETAVLVGLVPLVGLLVHRGDPLFAQSAFPWPLVVAVVIALRYGFAPGFAAAAAWIFLVVGAWKGLLPLALPVGRFPGERAVGTILVAMLAGEFCDAWTRRLAGMARAAAHGQRRFDSFARAYQVLRMSHQALETRASSQVSSLREGLRAVRELAEVADAGDAGQAGQVGEAGEPGEPGEPGLGAPPPGARLAQAILELFVRHAQVRLASVFLCDSRQRVQGAGESSAPRGQLAPGSSASALGQPLAAFGTPATATDPLIEEACRRGEAVGFEGLASAARAAAADSPGDARRKSELVLAVPLVDVDGTMWGLLAIRDLPFSAYALEHRRRMVVLAGYVADLLAFGSGTDGARATSRRTFTRDLERAVHDQRAYGIAAAMVRLDVAAAAHDALLGIVIHERRATDRVLHTGKRGGGAVMNVLLPFTDEEGITRYLARIEEQLRRRTGASLADSGVEVVSRSTLHEDATRRVIAELGADFEVAQAAAGLPS